MMQSSSAARLGGWIRLGILVTSVVLIVNGAAIIRDYSAASGDLAVASSHRVYSSDYSDKWKLVHSWSRPWAAERMIRVTADMAQAPDMRGYRTGALTVDWGAIFALLLAPLLVLWVFVPLCTFAFRWVRSGFKANLDQSSHSTLAHSTTVIAASDDAMLQTRAERFRNGSAGDASAPSVAGSTFGSADMTEVGPSMESPSNRSAGGCLQYFAVSVAFSLACGLANTVAVDYFIDQGQSLSAFDLIPRAAGAGFGIFVLTGIPVWCAGLLKRRSHGRFVSRVSLYVWMALMVAFSIVAFFGNKMRVEYFVR